MELIFELSSPQQQAFELHRSLSRCVTQDRKLKHRGEHQRKSPIAVVSVKGINFIRTSTKRLNQLLSLNLAPV